MKKALITGITGQDGSYLSEFLLYKGYEVHGIISRSSTFNTQRIDHLYVDPHTSGARFFLHYGDLSSFGQASYIIQRIEPDEIYNLGAQSHVRVSFDMPEYTGNITGLGVTRVLEAIRISRAPIKFYQASRRCLDTTRAYKEFGFKAKTSFEEGRKKTIQWYKTQRV